MSHVAKSSADLQSDTMKAKRQWNGSFQELK